MTINVKVTDLRPNLSATANNKYTIHIHGPNENNVKLAVAFDHWEPYAWSNQVAGGDATTISMIADEARDWSLLGATPGQVGGAISSGVLGSGSAIIFFPQSAGALVVADMAFNAIGWAVTQSGTPDPTTDKTVDADNAAYLNAIKEQQHLNDNVNAPNINDVEDCPTDARIKGVKFSLVAANPAKYWDYGVPRGRCHGGTRNIKYTESAEAYGTHGYTGQVNVYPIVFDRFVRNVWEWTVRPIP